MSTSFVPKHDQPFTIQEAMNLEIETLVAEIHRLENSLHHLKETERHLIDYLEGEDAEDGDGEINSALKENEVVIGSQEERIQMIKLALQRKVGEGSLSHYGLDLDHHSNPTTTNSNLNLMPNQAISIHLQPQPQSQPRPSSDLNSNSNMTTLDAPTLPTLTTLAATTGTGGAIDMDIRTYGGEARADSTGGGGEQRTSATREVQGDGGVAPDRLEDGIHL